MMPKLKNQIYYNVNIFLILLILSIVSLCLCQSPTPSFTFPPRSDPYCCPAYYIVIICIILIIAAVVGIVIAIFIRGVCTERTYEMGNDDFNKQRNSLKMENVDNSNSGNTFTSQSNLLTSRTSQNFTKTLKDRIICDV